jgi:tRNA threonylcarbamoyladenosine biosynthesis protein TsaB
MLLSIESSDRLCGVCVSDRDTDKIIASKTIDIGKGHAELLMGVIGDVLGEAKLDYSHLTSIAVCVGPGSFTGIRVGVSAAIGFGVALNIPLVGVTSLQALALENINATAEVLCLIDAHRGDVYMQTFSPNGAPLDTPKQVALSEIATLPTLKSKLLAGSGAAILLDAYPELDLKGAQGNALPSVENIARAATNSAMCVNAKPLYLRRPDAKPQESYTLARALR